MDVLDRAVQGLRNRQLSALPEAEKLKTTATSLNARLESFSIVSSFWSDVLSDAIQENTHLLIVKV